MAKLARIIDLAEIAARSLDKWHALYAERTAAAQAAQVTWDAHKAAVAKRDALKVAGEKAFGNYYKAKNERDRLANELRSDATARGHAEAQAAIAKAAS